VIRPAGLLLLTMTAACTLPPLRGRVEIGSDPYAVIVADGSGGSDLFAIHGRTGETIALTFSPVRELAPSLAPDGGAVAFLREPAGVDGGVRTAWVMNLLSGAERELESQATAGTPQRVAWAPDGSALYIETDRGTWRYGMPPGTAPQPLEAAHRAEADSAFMVLLGSPAFARAESCEAGEAVCVVSGQGTERLAADATSPARWGTDSVAFVRAGQIHVWPLGGGAPRRVETTPAHPVTGAISFFPGAVRQARQ
jgi:hypothetical protein